MIKERYPVSLALTHRGKKAAVTTLVLISIGVMLRDVIILSSSIIPVGLIIVQYLRQRSVLVNLERKLILSPSEVSESLVAGDEYRTQIQVESKMGFDYELSSSIESLFFRQGPEKKDLEIVFAPLLSGNYVDTSVHFVTRDGFDLVRGERDLPFALKFKVYPRVFPVALQAVNFLYESGASDTGSSPRQFRGQGLEYSESRDYFPGDPLNVVDWKATARLARPIVKEYLVEGGGGVSLLFDSTALDPVSLDVVSSEFLRVALSFASSQLSFDIILLNDGTISRVDASYTLSPVETALKMVLSGHVDDFFQYYSVLEPGKSEYMRKYVERMSDYTDPSLLEHTQLVHGIRERMLVIVSILSGDPVPVIETVQDNFGLSLVYQPAKPWIWADRIEESIAIKENHEKLMKVISGLGARVVFNFDELVQSSAQALIESPLVTG